jgi:hypothetical protein
MKVIAKTKDKKVWFSSKKRKLRKIKLHCMSTKHKALKQTWSIKMSRQVSKIFQIMLTFAMGVGEFIFVHNILFYL